MAPTPRQTPDGFSDVRVMAVVVFHARTRSLAPHRPGVYRRPSVVDESRYGAYATELSINVLTSSADFRRRHAPSAPRDVETQHGSNNQRDGFCKRDTSRAQNNRPRRIREEIRGGNVLSA